VVEKERQKQADAGFGVLSSQSGLERSKSRFAGFKLELNVPMLPKLLLHLSGLVRPERRNITVITNR